MIPIQGHTASLPCPVAAPSRPGAEPWLGPVADFRRPAAAVALYGAGAGVLLGASLAAGPLAALAALAVTLLGLLVLRRPVAGAYLLIGLAPVVSGLRRGLPVPGLRLSELITAGLAGLLLVGVETRRAPPWGPFDWAALAYVTANLGLGSFNLLQRGEPFTAENAGTLLGPLQFFLLYRAVRTVLTSDSQRRRALGLVLVSSIPVSLLAILQYASVPGVSGALASVTGVDAFVTAQVQELGARATGPFPHWQVLAGYLFVVVVVGLGALMAGERRVLPRWALVSVTGLALAAMVSTGTFVTTFGVVAALLVLGAWYRRLGRAALVLAVGVVLSGVFFGSLVEDRVDYSFTTAPGAEREALVPQSVAYRYELWTEQLLPALGGRWLTGYGPDLPGSVSFEYTESMYLTVLFRGGMPLLLIYGALMMALAAGAWRLARHFGGTAGTLGRVVFLLVVLLAVLHLLEPYFVTSGLPHLVWVLAALVFTVRVEHEASGPPIVTARAG